MWTLESAIIFSNLFLFPVYISIKIVVFTWSTRQRWNSEWKYISLVMQPKLDKSDNNKKYYKHWHSIPSLHLKQQIKIIKLLIFMFFHSFYSFKIQLIHKWKMCLYSSSTEINLKYYFKFQFYSFLYNRNRTYKYFIDRDFNS